MMNFFIILLPSRKGITNLWSVKILITGPPNKNYSLHLVVYDVLKASDHCNFNHQTLKTFKTYKYNNMSFVNLNKYVYYFGFYFT